MLEPSAIFRCMWASQSISVLSAVLSNFTLCFTLTSRVSLSYIVSLSFPDSTYFIAFIGLTHRHCHILIFILLYFIILLLYYCIHCTMYHLFAVCQTINQILLLLLLLQTNTNWMTEAWLESSLSTTLVNRVQDYFTLHGAKHRS